MACRGTGWQGCLLLDVAPISLNDGPSERVRSGYLTSDTPFTVQSHTCIITSQQNYVRDLNNYLQGCPRGNLTPHLSWDATEEGPGHQVTHHATVKFRGKEIGHGENAAKGKAMAAAAKQALQYFDANPAK
ncbi:hypothetical protein EI94DRAFT_1701516 [Lactarius quietus]|nr:hypothetical protein EI94DRAFT_1701516 [Lactarius quietus]